MDWSKLPDLLAVGLLAWAFASVARRSHTPVSSIWLVSWLLIVLHFAALMFGLLPGLGGTLGNFLGLVFLVWAGLFLMRAAVPYRDRLSSRVMHGVLLTTYTLFICTLQSPSPVWLVNLAAALLGLGPLAVAIATTRVFTHSLRWTTIALQSLLSLALLFTHPRVFGADWPYDAVLFTIYLSCAVHFCHIHRRGSTGSWITMAGFFAWASVFVVAPLEQTYLPAIHLDDEVWNLPKFVVAVGMILLLLEEQIAHNKHLALHDPLTGLPNRRLFQDRLGSALERARRMEIPAALLILDLNRFKQVNDTYGHHAGDLLLKKVAHLLGHRVRRSDTVARTGGDEFAIILEAPTTREEATVVGQSLLDILDGPMKLEEHEVRVGASVGVAIFPEDAVDMEALFIKADLRMYDSKRHQETVNSEKKAPMAERPNDHLSLVENHESC